MPNGENKTNYKKPAMNGYWRPIALLVIGALVSLATAYFTYGDDWRICKTVVLEGVAQASDWREKKSEVMTHVNSCTPEKRRKEVEATVTPMLGEVKTELKYIRRDMDAQTRKIDQILNRVMRP